MKGHQHLTLSLATAGAWLSRDLNNFSLENGLLLGGVALGSLIPDVDARKAAIFNNLKTHVHPAVDSLFRLSIGWIFPLLGYLTRFLIFLPIVLVLKVLFPGDGIDSGHRGIAHSLVGLLGFVAVTGLYLAIGLQSLNTATMPVITPFLSGYFAGGLLHLIQDSCTRQGVAWYQPFSSSKLAGTLKTPQSSWRPAFLLYVLIGLAVVIHYWPSIANEALQAPIAVGAILGIWGSFMVVCRIHVVIHA